MKVYKIEIFTPELQYRSSCQIRKVEYSYDYLDIEKNKILIPEIIAEKYDYIRIKRGTEEYCGIISDVIVKKGKYEITYKPFERLWDIDIYMNPDDVEGYTIENILRKYISAVYENNADALENIVGLSIQITSATNGKLFFEQGINNLYEMVIGAFTSYGVACSFSINPQKKRIQLHIGKCMKKAFVIEADRANVIEKEIVIKESDESVNKLIVYNQEDYEQSATFYKNTAGEVTLENGKRIIPVVTKSVTVKVPNEKTFDEVALTKAQQVLKPLQYDNLIEIKILKNDLLVRPTERVIGQEATILSNGVAYSTILTGIVMDEYCTLVFGAIRLELTKIIKRRWRNEQH